MVHHWVWYWVDLTADLSVDGLVALWVRQLAVLTAAQWVSLMVVQLVD
jgi:hypothetical protein